MYRVIDSYRWFCIGEESIMATLVITGISNFFYGNKGISFKKRLALVSVRKAIARRIGHLHPRRCDISGICINSSNFSMAFPCRAKKEKEKTLNGYSS